MILSGRPDPVPPKIGSKKLVRSGPVKNRSGLVLSNQVTGEVWDLKNVHPCRYCHFTSACRRFETGTAPRHAVLLEQLIAERVAGFQAAVNPPTPRGGS